MSSPSQPEVWLRGPILDIPPLLQPVAHTLLQAREEVEALMERKLNPSLPIMRAIGVREIAAYLSSSITRDEAIAAGQQATRRYAKRQYTWFRRQPPADWPRFERPLDSSAVRAELVETLLSTQAR